MKIILNGEETEIDEASTLADLLARLDLPRKAVAIERNKAIAPRSLWGETRLKEGDRLEVVHFVGGG